MRTDHVAIVGDLDKRTLVKWWVAHPKWDGFRCEWEESNWKVEFRVLLSRE